MNDGSEASELQEIVRVHSVCFDVWPLQEVHAGQLSQVGFEVDLVGALDHPRHAPTPGCADCEALYHKLRRLASAALPADTTMIRVEIQEFDASFHESKQRGFREDVELQMMVMHRFDHELPVDGAERSCLQQIKDKLRSFGAREGRGSAR